MPLFSTCAIASRGQLLLSSSLSALLGDQRRVAVAHGDAARLGAAAEGLAEHVADVDRADPSAGHAGDVEHRHAAEPASADLDLDLLVVELAGAQLAAERSRGSAGDAVAPTSASSTPLLGARARPWPARPCACVSRTSADADLDQIADDLLDVAADIADLGELGRLDLEERRAGQLGEAARDLGLADSRSGRSSGCSSASPPRAVARQLLAAPAVAQRDGDGALGVALADDVAVELGDDLARGEGDGLPRSSQFDAGFRRSRLPLV